MKYLLYADVVVTAFGAVMTVVLGVVCLLFAVYHDAAPMIDRDLPSLLLVTVAFAVLMGAAGAATIGVYRRRRWLWWAQAGLVVLIPLIVGVVRAGLGSR